MVSTRHVLMMDFQVKQSLHYTGTSICTETSKSILKTGKNKETDDRLENDTYLQDSINNKRNL